MAVQLNSSPEYPVPGRSAKLRFTLTGSGANFVRVWLTDAPQGSKHRTKLDQEGFTRDPVYAGPGGNNAELRFDPDVGGRYGFVAQEYTQGAAPHGGRYENDPDSDQTLTAVGGETTLNLDVGVRLTQTLGTAADTATLVLYTWNDTIRPTTFGVHGERSPVIIEPTSQSARVASFSSAVTTALSDLEGETPTAAGGDPSDVIDDLINNFNAHRTQTNVHDANDTDNVIDASFKDPAGPKGFVESVNEFLRALRLHMRNANADDSTIGSQAYHDVSGKKADLANLPLIESAGGLGPAIAACADGWRSYEAHRQSTAVHDSADATNDAAALPTIFELHRAFMESLRQSNPTAPSTESTAAIQLVQSFGFEESPL